MHVKRSKVCAGEEEVFPVSGNRFRGWIVRADKNDRCDHTDAEVKTHLQGCLAEGGRRDGECPPTQRGRPRDSSRPRVIDVQIEGPRSWIVDSSYPVSVQAGEDCNGSLLCADGFARVGDGQLEREGPGTLIRVFGS